MAQHTKNQTLSESPDAIHYEYVLPDGTRTDHILNDLHAVQALVHSYCAGSPIRPNHFNLSAKP